MHFEHIARWPGNSSAGHGLPEHPAAYHMLDVAAVAEVLLADHPRRELYCLLIALHDLGKIGIVFRNALRDNVMQDRKHWEVTEAWLCHPTIQQAIFQKTRGSHFALNPLIAAISGHHGKPPTVLPDRMCQRAGPEALQDALFNFNLRPMQQAAQDIALPAALTLAMIQDETGAGKTEAVFIPLQRMLCLGKGQGVYLALRLWRWRMRCAGGNAIW